MPNNEENTEAPSTNATSGPVAPAPTQGKTPTATNPPSAGTSRFYSRLSRGVGSPAKPAAAEAGPVSIEGLSAEEAVQLKDNLPVRANYDGPIDERRDEGPRDRERRPRADSRDDRPSRGRERGRNRDQDRDRGRGRDFREREPQESAPTEYNAEETPAETETETEAAEPMRQLRFEDVADNHTPQTVQEFRPSTDRGFAADAGRAQRRREERAAPIEPTKAKSGLLGWMKSIFNPTPEEPATSTPTPEPRGPRRERGPRRDRRSGGGGGGGGGKPKQGGPQSRGSDQDGGNRRRRRRGGRNRRRPDGGGGGSGGRSGPPSGNQG